MRVTGAALTFFLIYRACQSVTVLCTRILIMAAVGHASSLADADTPINIRMNPARVKTGAKFALRSQHVSKKRAYITTGSLVPFVSERPYLGQGNTRHI